MKYHAKLWSLLGIGLLSLYSCDKSEFFDEIGIEEFQLLPAVLEAQT